jgi:hypothetical protein
MSDISEMKDALSHHLGDLRYRFQQDGGGESGLEAVNYTTCSTPSFETVEDFEKYTGDLETLINKESKDDH